MCLEDHGLKNVSIFYFVVIRPIEKFLETREVTVQVSGFSEESLLHDTNQ